MTKSARGGADETDMGSRAGSQGRGGAVVAEPAREPMSEPSASGDTELRHTLGQRPWTEPLRLQARTSPRHTPCAQPSELSPVPLTAPPSADDALSLAFLRPLEKQHSDRSEDPEISWNPH